MTQEIYFYTLDSCLNADFFLIFHNIKMCISCTNDILFLFLYIQGHISKNPSGGNVDVTLLQLSNIKKYTLYKASLSHIQPIKIHFNLISQVILPH